MILAPHGAWAAERFVVRTWQAEDGLPQNSGTAIVQTSDGYLWVGTFNGLMRFNGVGFKRFTVANVKELPADDINALHEDRGGRLWIGTSSGLVYYEGGRFTHWRAPEKLRRANVRTLAERGDGTMFVGTRDGLWQIANGHATEIDVPDAAWPGLACAAVCGSNGAVWVSYKDRLFQLQDGQLRLQGCLSNTIVSLAAARDGAVWCGWENRLVRWQDGHAPVETLVLPGDSRLLCDAENGDLWVGTLQHGLRRWRDGKLTPITTAQGLASDRILALTEDREENLWVGTDGGGFSRLSPAPLTTYTTEHGLTDSDVISVVEDRDGRIWLGLFYGTLCVGEEGRWRRFSVPGTPEEITAVVALCQARDGTFWIGQRGRPLRGLRHGAVEIEPRSQVGSVRVLLEDRAGRLWIGSQDRGVEYLRGTQAQRWSTANGLSHNTVTALAEDQAGAIWVGTPDGLNRLTSMAEDTKTASLQTWAVEVFTARDGLGINRIHALFVDSAGTLWIGTEGGGLTRYQDGRFRTVTSAHGLQSDVVAQVLEDDEGNLWIGSPTGIFRVAVESVHDVMDGRSQLLRCLVYGKNEGMRSVDCPGGFQPTCAKTRDGRLWFCTSGGVTVFDPREARRASLPPPVHVERVLADGLEMGRENQDARVFASGVPAEWEAGSDKWEARGPRSEAENRNRKAEINNPSTSIQDQGSKIETRKSPPLTIPPGVNRLEFHCAALSFAAPAQTQYQFWLEGFDETWQDAGTRRVAHYNRVPPGRYRFHVKGANSDGVWNESAATLALVIRPTWRQTIWFRAATLTAFLSAIALIIFNRVSDLKRAASQQTAFSRQLIESQETERKRIAAELHDSLGQSILIVKNRAFLGLQQPDGSPILRQQLKSILEMASGALREVRQIARALRPPHLERLSLSQVIQTLADQTAEAGSLRVELALDDLEGLFSPEQRMVLYRIVQESLANVMKHAGATGVQLTIRRETGRVRLEVRDDGCGFNVSEFKGLTPSRKGFGLLSLAERARILGGVFSVQSSPGQGTRVTVEIPVSERGEGGPRSPTPGKEGGSN